MDQRVNRRERTQRVPRPLDAAGLRDLALAYVARFATSAAKLERYLVRKVRERGWDGDVSADPGAIALHLVELGYVDDEAYAAAKSGSLLRRGYGGRRIGQALAQAGIAAETRAAVQPGESAARQAVLAYARKRRLGPFGAPVADRAQREKQIAALLRAGHRLDSAREIVDAADIAAAESWAAEPVDES
ncbi:MAG: RecX family transcriptional regulator [Croceibacterium sp.]